MAAPEATPTFASPSKSLPLDHAFDVMKRLPVKSLMRFKCLSKEYNEMIVSSAFAEEYEPSDTAKAGLMISCMGKHLKGVEFFTASLEDGCSSHLMSLMPCKARYVTPSINGLVCVDCGTDVIVCNPSINKSIVLPPIPAPTHHSSFGVNWLGYDPDTDIYKVLNARPYPSAKYRVCTLGETDLNWRFIDGGPICRSHPGSICVDGCIYFWATKDVEGDESDDSNDESLILVRFDVKKESFTEIELPSDDMAKSNLIDFNGSLVIANEKFNYKRKIRFWLLKYKDSDDKDSDDNDSDHDNDDEKNYEWFKGYSTVDFPENWKELKGDETYFMVDLIGESYALLAPRTSSKPFHVILFNHNNNSLRKIEITGLLDHFKFDPSCINNISVTMFTENFFLPG